MLIDDDYAFSENPGHSEISLYYNESLLNIFLFSETSELKDSVDLKRNLLKGIGGFAIEAYPPGSGFESGDCMKYTSEQLRPLIDSCTGSLKMRLLTSEEREQLGKYKEEQKGELTLNFKRILSANCSLSFSNSVKKAF